MDVLRDRHHRQPLLMLLLLSWLARVQRRPPQHARSREQARAPRTSAMPSCCSAKRARSCAWRARACARAPRQVKIAARTRPQRPSEDSLQARSCLEPEYAGAVGLTAAYPTLRDTRSSTGSCPIARSRAREQRVRRRLDLALCCLSRARVRESFAGAAQAEQFNRANHASQLSEAGWLGVSRTLQGTRATASCCVPHREQRCVRWACAC